MKLAVLFIVFISIIVLTGCVKADMHVTANKDGSADMKVTVGIEDAFIQENGEMSVTSSSEEFKEEGFSIEEFSKDGYSGFVASKRFDDASKIEFQGNHINIISSDSFFKSSYEVKGTLSDGEEPSEENGEASSEEMTELDMPEVGALINDQFDVNFLLTLPGEVTAHNANTYDQQMNTLTWDMNSGLNLEIQAQSSQIKWTNIGFVFGGITFFGLILGFLVIRKSF